ncbi:hypothetical protein MHAS44199_18870 [Mycolicibacterium hassiacum DSM 44199]|nr:hypothetical protein [Mycolicibacterium hassiacum DSM 44199]
MLQQAAKVVDMPAGSGGGKAFVSQRYGAGGNSAEQLQDFDVAFPGQDALGAVYATEHFDECLHGYGVGGMVQQNLAEVFT